MGVFKNGVGRPSNETIKKRRIIYVLSALATVAAIASTAYMLNSSFSSKKISGFVRNTNNIEIKIDENLSMAIASNEYYYSKPMKYKIEIKNNEKYKVYYMIDYNYSKSGQIDSGKSFIFYLDENELKDNVRVWKNIQIYKSASDLKNYSNVIFEDSYNFFYRKYLVDTYIYDPPGGNNIGGVTGRNIKENPMEKESIDYYHGLENYNFKAYIYIKNASSKNYYYRIFNYSDSKVNISKLKNVSECKMVNAQKDSKYVQDVILDSKNSKKTYKVKVYSSEGKCKSDKKGLAKSGVIFTDTRRHIFSYNKFVVEKEKELNSYSLCIIPPTQAKNWNYELYYKKTMSNDKWKKVSSDERSGGREYIDLVQQQYNSETFRLYLKVDIDNVPIAKWKADGFKKIKRDGVIWIYKDFVINWKKKKL